MYTDYKAEATKESNSPYRRPIIDAGINSDVDSRAWSTPGPHRQN